MISILENRKAFNIVANDSLLIFQFSNNLIPCAAQIVYSHDAASADLSVSVLHAYNSIMEEYPPDNAKVALIFDNLCNPLAEQTASVLISEGYCKSVYIVSNEESFLEMYPFLTSVSTSHFPIYANEITDALYLGGIGSVNDRALTDLGDYNASTVRIELYDTYDSNQIELICFCTLCTHLGISAVLSVVHHPLQHVPECVTHHVRFSIEDEVNANVAQFFDQAILFIAEAHARGQKVSKLLTAHSTLRTIPWSSVCTYLIPGHGENNDILGAHPLPSRRLSLRECAHCLYGPYSHM